MSIQTLISVLRVPSGCASGSWVGKQWAMQLAWMVISPMSMPETPKQYHVHQIQCETVDSALWPIPLVYISSKIKQSHAEYAILTDPSSMTEPSHNRRMPMILCCKRSSRKLVIGSFLDSNRFGSLLLVVA